MRLQDSRSVEAAKTGDLCGECPLWLPEEQALLWSDITGRRAHRLDAASGAVTCVQEGFEIAGLLAHRNGGYTVVNSQGVWHWDGAASYTRYQATRFEGGRFESGNYPSHLNDCVADASGRLLTGSTFFSATDPYARGSLFSFDLDGSVQILHERLHLSNGLAFSPDGTLLYVTDSVARRIYRFDYHQRDGSACNERVLVQVREDEGMPDGLTVDSTGYLWSAQWYGGAVVRYDPDGREQMRFELPAKQVSSVAFGGPDLTDLYVTSASKAEAGPVPRGYTPSGELGGSLYRIRTEVQGLVENKTAIGMRQSGTDYR